MLVHSSWICVPSNDAWSKIRSRYGLVHESSFIHYYITMMTVIIMNTFGLQFTANSSVCFGGLISTSNTYERSSVEIECNHTLFWAMGTEKEL